MWISRSRKSDAGSELTHLVFLLPIDGSHRLQADFRGFGSVASGVTASKVALCCSADVPASASKRLAKAGPGRAYHVNLRCLGHGRRMLC
jgi:hypothetical protein